MITWRARVYNRASSPHHAHTGQRRASPEYAGALPLPGGRLYPARLILFPTVCWRRECRSDTTAIGGALVATRPHLGDVYSDLIPRGWAFLSFDTVADAVVQLIPAEQLTRHGVGPLKRRSSKTARSSYISNGCRECDALIGSHPLQEELLAEGKPFDSYLSIPLSLPEDLWAENDDHE